MKKPLSIPLRRALHKLGSDIQSARKRRRIGTQLMAERAAISRTTLNKIEKGDANVAMGNYAEVLFILGFTDRLKDLVDVIHDRLGLDLEEEHLPKRIRYKKSKS